MKILLATDLCRYLIKEREPELLTTLQNWSAGNDEIFVSSITYAELVAGAMLTKEQSRHMSLVKEFCDRLDDIVPWDAGAVDAYSEIQIEAMQQGVSMNMNDAMLAAHALSLGARLLMVNASNLDSVKGLSLQVWQAS